MLRILFIVLMSVFICSSCEITQPKIIEGSQTTFHFSIYKQTRVRVDVVNAYNTIIKNIMDKDLLAGQYEAVWDVTDENNQKAVEGLYYFELYIDGALTQTSPIIIGVNK
ncbi:MAG: hypothetical protein ACYCVH_15535 [Ignavibacteriaceae bacterium]